MLYVTRGKGPLCVGEMNVMHSRLVGMTSLFNS